jgi:hypothetical protein
MLGEAVLNLLRHGYGVVKSYRMAGQACADLWTHARTQQQLGRFPTQAEYSRECKLDGERPVQRQWARIREAFDLEEGENPERVTGWVIQATSGNIEDPSVVTRIPPVPPGFALR